ncbi:MAG: hypothetical protein JW862_11430 [Anaerolineales bacterium]|nr:hypothetical protein [Anaerolineales bacterium]
MTSAIDLLLLPINRQAGQEHSDLPSLLLVEAPRRAARGRSSDQLILHLALDGTAPLTAKAMRSLLDSLAATYFKTSGSATTAMQAVAEVLNEYLLGRNLRGQSRGMQAYGLFTMAVLRGDHLYLGQSAGSGAVFVQAAGIQHLADSGAGRGLGAGRVSALRFRQVRLVPGDVLLICPALPGSWTEPVLAGLHSQPFESLHQRLLQRSGAQLEAVLIQARAGEGHIQLVRSKRQAETSPEQPVAAQTPQPTPPAPLPSQPPDRSQSLNPPAAGFGTPLAPAVVSAPVQVQPERPVERRPKEPSPLGPAIKRFFQALFNTGQHTVQSLNTLLRRMLPDESLFNLPTSVMAFIALAVPVFVVAIAMLVYVNQSRDTLYTEFMGQARLAYDQSLGQEDPANIRQAWEQVLAAVNQAEVYRVTEESLALRSQAYRVLDELDIVQRLDFRPALLEELPQGFSITRMVLTAANELYLLNANGGNVWRAIPNGTGYEIDPNFACGPVPHPLIVGPLVDIVALPVTSGSRATIMGMDANGNLLQCIPGESPLAFQLGFPDTNWGNPSAFDLDGLDLYVLDSLTNAVWVYDSDQYRDSPDLFFGNEVPPMQDVIDLAVVLGDLFLLHADGQITYCVQSPTRCTDLAEFTDRRQGYDSGTQMVDTLFSEIQDVTRPETALYLLDQQEQALFFFSRRLAMQHQYRATDPLPQGEISAFYIGENRLAFMALGHQVFYAQLP